LSVTESFARRSATDEKNAFFTGAEVAAASAAFFAVEEEPAAAAPAAAAAAPDAAVDAPPLGPPGPGPEAPTIGGRMRGCGSEKARERERERGANGESGDDAAKSFSFSLPFPFSLDAERGPLFRRSIKASSVSQSLRFSLSSLFDLSRGSRCPIDEYTVTLLQARGTAAQRQQ
jgi:hypothetical protein